MVVRGRGYALEAELQRGKELQKSTRFAGAGWVELGGFNPEAVQRGKRRTLSFWLFIS